MDSTTVFSRIEERLGFVPPFFAPAAEHPVMLDSLWRQTESCYLDNPLPTLLKEKLAALLGRYCEVPYCLVCHTCSLRPLGMDGPAIFDLLTQQHASNQQVTAALDRLGRELGTIDLHAQGSAEPDVFCLAAAIYSGGPLASVSRVRLRERLSAADYKNVIAFTSYNKMCHEWMAAHPEVSYELDQRYLQHHGPLSAEAPGLAELFTGSKGDRDEERVERIRAVVSERNAEAASAIAISERRFLDVVATLRDRVATAMSSANEKQQLALELGRTADFAQELLAIVSHDLRVPLSTVLMGAQALLRREAAQPRTAATLDRIVSSARRAERLIHDLLDFSQARLGGGIPIHPRPGDLRSIVGSVVEEVQLTHPSRTIRVEHEGEGQGDWDADRLDQILSNLLANALSHGRADTPIEVATRGDRDTVTILVHNTNQNGPISEDVLPVLFEPFQRGIDRAVSPSRSVGLGLYIVSELVLGHRGQVYAASTSSGTTFTVHLPRSAACPAIPGASA